MKAKDLKGKTTQELYAQEAEFKKELFNLRMQHATGQGENPMMLRSIKKDIARVKTVISAKQKGA